MYLLACVIFRYLKFTLIFILLRGLIELLVGISTSIESLNNIFLESHIRRSQWPRGLRRRSAAARLLRLWVRIPPEAWMFIVIVLCC